MDWLTCRLYKATAESTDELGNPVYGEPELVASIPCRYSAYDNAVVSGQDGNKVTSDTQFFTLNKPKAYIPDFDFVEVESRRYEVLELIDSGPRWTILKCRSWKNAIRG